MTGVPSDQRQDPEASLIRYGFSSLPSFDCTGATFTQCKN